MENNIFDIFETSDNDPISFPGHKMIPGNDGFYNVFVKEPKFNCPVCNMSLHTDWVDNGFGPFSVQASPYMCECGWHEVGCDTCIKEHCFSWDSCKGRALKPGTTPL